MTARTKLTDAQARLLRSVADDKVINLGALYCMDDRRCVRERIRKLYERGLVDPWGKPVIPEVRTFAGYHRVTLTEAGRRALDDAEEATNAM